MAKAIRYGGFYIGTDGRAHDADGEDLGRPLPDDLPQKQRGPLEDADLLTVEEVANFDSLHGLTAVSGVGAARAAKIRQALGLASPEPEDDGSTGGSSDSGGESGGGGGEE